MLLAVAVAELPLFLLMWFPAKRCQQSQLDQEALAQVFLLQQMPRARLEEQVVLERLFLALAGLVERGQTAEQSPELLEELYLLVVCVVTRTPAVLLVKSPTFQDKRQPQLAEAHLLGQLAALSLLTELTVAQAELVRGHLAGQDRLRRQ